jgi:hypothetical protein
MELGNHSLSFLKSEHLGLLKPDSDLADLNLQLLPQAFGILVVLLFLREITGQPGHLIGKVLGSVFSGSLGIDGVIKVNLHTGDVSFHAAFVIGDGLDNDGELTDTGRGFGQLTFSVLAASFGLKAR